MKAIVVCPLLLVVAYAYAQNDLIGDDDKEEEEDSPLNLIQQELGEKPSRRKPVANPSAAPTTLRSPNPTGGGAGDNPATRGPADAGGDTPTADGLAPPFAPTTVAGFEGHEADGGISADAGVDAGFSTASFPGDDVGGGSTRSPPTASPATTGPIPDRSAATTGGSRTGALGGTDGPLTDAGLLVGPTTVGGGLGPASNAANEAQRRRTEVDKLASGAGGAKPPRFSAAGSSGGEIGGLSPDAFLDDNHNNELIYQHAAAAAAAAGGGSARPRGGAATVGIGGGALDFTRGFRDRSGLLPIDLAFASRLRAVLPPPRLTAGGSLNDPLVGPPGPFNFAYVAPTEAGGAHARSEVADAAGRRVGFYTVRQPDGHLRRVNYVADHDGFRAEVLTNEPGTDNQNPASAIFRSAAALPFPERRSPAHVPRSSLAPPAIPVATPVGSIAPHAPPLPPPLWSVGATTPTGLPLSPSDVARPINPLRYPTAAQLEARYRFPTGSLFPDIRMRYVRVPDGFRAVLVPLHS